MNQIEISRTKRQTPVELASEPTGFDVHPHKVSVEKVEKEAPADSKQARAAELSARARLEHLFDAGTFVEIDAQVQHRARDFGMAAKILPGDGVICGFGEIEGQTTYAFSQDRTVLGGSLGEAHAHKITKIMDLAGNAGCPIIAINDSGGARIQEGVESLCGYGEIFRRNVKYSGVVPQISLLLGTCAGGAVYSPALTDFVIMVEHKSYMFVTGPKVVKAVTSEDVTMETLGGGRVHSETSGVSHFLVHSEVEALELARKLLSYFPANNCSPAPVGISEDPVWRRCDDLTKIVPEQANRPYDVNDVIARVFDKGSFLEVHAGWAQNVRVGLARLGGHSVGVIANNPAVLAGVLDIDASRKAAHMIRTCNAFGLPIISLIDVPGFLPGKSQEHGGIINHGAKLMYAYCEATVPKLSVVLRKAYGGAYIVMSSKHVGGDFNFAWPTAEIAVMGASGAVEILHGKELATATDAKTKAAELTAAYNANYCNPKVAEERGYLDAVIDPAETRSTLYKALRATMHKREEMPQKKNGNIPL